MKTPKLEKRLVAILSEDSQLKKMWVREPSAIYIPFRGSRESFYLLVSIYLDVKAADFEKLAYACLSTLRLLAHSDLLVGYSGVEVVPYVTEDLTPKRVLRLSVESNAIERAKEMKSSDLLRDNPEEGITCGWYYGKP